MKKIVAVLLTAMMVVTFTACANKVECSFCKEKKECTAATFMNQDVNICEECMVEFEALKDLYSYE